MAIDWSTTNQKFGYSSVQEIGTIFRPKVVCRCDGCDKAQNITIRVKSRIVNNQMSWRCPACVGKKLSPVISKRMKEKWQDEDYKHQQKTLRKSSSYIKAASEAASRRWEDDEYRSKFKSISTADFVVRAKERWKELFDYTNTVFTSWTVKLEVVCNSCKTTTLISPQNHLDFGSCKKCGVSSQQREIVDYIESFGRLTTVNDRSVISPLEIDIYVPDLNFGVEYHGYYWHSFNVPETTKEKMRHQVKALLAIQNNINLKQFYCFEWQQKNQLLKSMISNYVGGCMHLHARKCKIFVIKDEKKASDFFSKNHLQGHRPARHYLALLYNDKIVSMISINKHKDGYELIRMATLQNYRIVGGASKLIKNGFIQFTINKLYTFADLRYSSGDVYKKTEFEHLHITKPNYKYITKNVLLSRQQCQKHKLHKLLGDSFDPKLTEAENMFSAGYRRLWDAGNIKMVRNG